MGAKTDPTRVAVMRQDFMAGASLRQLAEKHGLTLRTLARWSRAGEWDKDRSRQRMSTALPSLERAADERAAAVNKTWEERLQGTIDSLAYVVERTSVMLTHVDMEKSDLRDLCGMLKIAVDALDKIRGMVTPATPEVICSIPESELRAKILKLIDNKAREIYQGNNPDQFNMPPQPADSYEEAH